jgi:hypothetical protein
VFGFNRSKNKYRLLLLRTGAVLIVLGTIWSRASAQDEFISSWQNRVRSTIAQQSPWPFALFTPSPNLAQLFRYSFVHQITPGGNDTWNYGFSKGFNLVPWYNTEFDINVPPYIQRSSGINNGFGDFGMSLKYRLASGNLEHGAYTIAFSLSTTLPTGSYQNGAKYPTLGPTFHAGKGYKNFDVITSLGATLPTSDGATLGRPVVWNVVGQYRVCKLFWPEIENNATFFHGGSNDGQVQNFVSPGIVVSPLKLTSDPKNRMGFILGIGEQIATTHFHTFNHGLMMDARFVF